MNRRELLAALSSAGAILPTLDPGVFHARVTRLRHRPGDPLGPFSPHQAAIVSRMAELILPATDTPGALEANVPEFIAVIVGEWYPREDVARFMAGLEEVDARSRQRWNRTFPDLTEPEQVELLTALDREVQALRARKEPTDGNFFQRMKGLTLYGYYTSEVGMNEELHYSIIPGRYDPCSPVRTGP